MYVCMYVYIYINCAYLDCTYLGLSYLIHYKIKNITLEEIMINIIDPKPKILIVDDNRHNIDLIKDILGDKYEYSFAMNGVLALETIARDIPDLILLDIMMPKMNGYEFLKCIREKPIYNCVFVMMLTSMSESEDLIRALELGANHYIKKPFDPQEIRAWVKTLIRMKKAEDKLKESISILEHNAALGIQTAGFAHDLNNILNNLIGTVIVEKALKKIEKKLEQETKETIEKEISTIREFNSDIRTTVDLGRSICSNVVSFSKTKDSLKYLWNLKDIITIPLGIYMRQIKNYGIKLITEYQDTSPVLCKKFEIQRIVLNIVSNAIDSMQHSSNKELTIKLYNEKEWVLLSISDTGHGISKENQDKIFERFFTTKKSRDGAGIGLDTVKKIVDNYDGKIVFYSKENIGSTFTLYFPSGDTR